MGHINVNLLIFEGLQSPNHLPASCCGLEGSISQLSRVCEGSLDANLALAPAAFCYSYRFDGNGIRKG
jgi:hypothetical protein